jgi:hypothetical protein
MFAKYSHARVGGAGFSLQRRLQPPSGPGLKPRLQAKARSTACRNVGQDDILRAVVNKRVKGS